MFHNISLLLINLIHSNLYLLISCIYLVPTPIPFPTGNHYFVVYICEYISVLLYSFICFIFIVHILAISCSIYLSLTYFPKHKYPPDSLMLLQLAKFLVFICMWVCGFVFVCVCTHITSSLCVFFPYLVYYT